MFRWWNHKLDREIEELEKGKELEELEQVQWLEYVEEEIIELEEVKY